MIRMKLILMNLNNNLLMEISKQMELRIGWISLNKKTLFFKIANNSIIVYLFRLLTMKCWSEVMKYLTWTWSSIKNKVNHKTKAKANYQKLQIKITYNRNFIKIKKSLIYNWQIMIECKYSIKVRFNLKNRLLRSYQLINYILTHNLKFHKQ